jgi:predicted small lipoprotein YifL
MQSAKVILLILICVGLLGACGLKGPLYLPDDDPAAKSADKQQSSQTADGTKDGKDTKKDKKHTPVPS